MRWMLKNSKGEQDSMLSFAVVGLLVTCLVTILSIIEEVSIGSFDMKFKEVDNVLALGILASTLTAYINRRNTKDKYQHEKEMKDV